VSARVTYRDRCAGVFFDLSDWSDWKFLWRGIVGPAKV